MLSVPATNPVLVGARPGDIYTSRCRTDIRAHDLAVFPPFEAVWAFLGDVLHCSRRSRIINVQATAPIRASAVRGSAAEMRRLRAWCNMILDASKRLALESDDPIISKLWAKYRRTARDIRKQLK